ncbi:MAG: hypothetical protein IT424_03365 [Pirellulales bacterium]|nr:hypothetical protein [Pirellulales bacterium]
MSQQKPQDRVGATPGKLALIAVLAVVLAAVVASNWQAEEPSAPVADSVAAPSARAAARAVGETPSSSENPQSDSQGSPFGDFAADDNWPEANLREVTACDPLAAAGWAVPPDGDGENGGVSEQQIKELRTAQNAIIFLAGDTRVARIGDREFRIGDTIGHFKISEISSKGVILSEAE